MRSLYIINSSSRAANYGIGTYVQQLIDVVKDSLYKVNVINLNAEGLSESCIEEVNGIRYFKVASPKFGRDNLSKCQSHYYRNVYYFLAPHIADDEEIVFHFNLIQGEELVRLFRKKFKCKTLLTIHYMDWSFSLLGDVKRLKSILENSENEKDKSIKEAFEYEQKFIKQNFDHVIAIAKHSYDTLLSVYKIPSSEITIVPNGLQDQYHDLTMEEKRVIRKSFHFKEDEILLIFAGRLDEVKGASYLLKALNNVLETNDNVRLIIAGDGNYKSCFESSYPNWSKVIYTGFIDKDKLYTLYSIADIGIVPSLHEEFGYVALEMMMNGLPLIVNNTTGLSEIVHDGMNGSYVSINQNSEQLEVSLRLFSSKIEELILNEPKRNSFAQQGRAYFKLTYEHTLFKNKMIAVYDFLFSQIN